MIDERDLLTRIIASAEAEASEAVGPRLFDKQADCRLIISILERALATQPDPVPELPEFVTVEDKAAVISLQCGREVVIGSYYTPDDLDRIAEAARILAARERARRAGS